jgi:hypothetical protein
MHGLTAACEAAAKTFRPHSCIPERSILQSTGFVDVQTVPMLPSGFRTVTNTMRHSTLPANAAMQKMSFMSAPDQSVLIVPVIRGPSGRGFARIADALSFVAVGVAWAASIAANA